MKEKLVVTGSKATATLECPGCGIFFETQFDEVHGIKKTGLESDDSEVSDGR